jgi:uncharacterized membrane protein
MKPHRSTRVVFPTVLLLLVVAAASINGFSIPPPTNTVNTNTAINKAIRSSSSSPLLLRQSARSNNKHHHRLRITTLHESPSSSSSSSSNEQQQEFLGDEADTIWLPPIRCLMGGIALAGSLETAFVTFEKLTGQISTLCGVDGNCNAVLTGPYSTLPFVPGEIPLSAVGCLAYTVVAYLALAPLLPRQLSAAGVTLVLSADDNTHTDTNTDTDTDGDDSGNRIALTALTTAMATFSTGLMILLFGVLQTTCPYCIFSAVCSVSLAMLAYFGGCLPNDDNSKKGASNAVSASFLTSTLGVLLLFVSGGGGGEDVSFFSFPSASSSSNSILLAKGGGGGGGSPGGSSPAVYAPPAVETDSSPRTMALAKSLQSLNAKMYGAYWCSHCFDQKELFGKQALRLIDYVECSKEGVNSQTKLCKENKVPGYPTWEIQGELYPGQQELDELEELVKTLQQTTKSSSSQ